MQGTEDSWNNRSITKSAQKAANTTKMDGSLSQWINIPFNEHIFFCIWIQKKWTQIKVIYEKPVAIIITGENWKLFLKSQEQDKDAYSYQF